MTSIRSRVVALLCGAGLCIVLAGNALAATRPSKPADLRSRIVRVIKQIKNIFALGVDDDGIGPPKP